MLPPLLLLSRSRTRHHALTHWAFSFLRAQWLFCWCTRRGLDEVSENSNLSLFVTPKCISWSLSFLEYLSSTDHAWSIYPAKEGLEPCSRTAEELSFNPLTTKVPPHWTQQADMELPIRMQRDGCGHPWGGHQMKLRGPGQHQPKEAVPPAVCSRSVRCMARGWHGWIKASRGHWMS